jgi:hypothetical protein
MDVTKLDRNLLVRAMRNLGAMAEDQDIRVQAAIDAKNMKQAKAEKAEADRQHRDLRDLAALKKRIDNALKKPATSPA